VGQTPGFVANFQFNTRLKIKQQKLDGLRASELYGLASIIWDDYPDFYFTLPEKVLVLLRFSKSLANLVLAAGPRCYETSSD
jgi:hypothetical protein